MDSVCKNHDVLSCSKLPPHKNPRLHILRSSFWKTFQKRTAFNRFQCFPRTLWPKRIMCLRTSCVGWNPQQGRMKPSTPKCNQALRGFPRTPRGNYICCYIVTRCLNHFPRSLTGGKCKTGKCLTPHPVAHVARHLVWKMAIFCSFAHHFSHQKKMPRAVRMPRPPCHSL